MFVVLGVLASAPAYAFHNGKTFDAAPGAGGAGGLFYTGSTRERGWDCTACHLEPRGRLAVDIASEPAELLGELRYTPGTTYTITIAMADPTAQLGIAATRSNFNGIAASFLDDAGAPSGMIAGFDPGRFYARGTSILASDSVMVNETSWTFTWTAPTSGLVAIRIGVVDGNGADGIGGATTLTDPLGDDVVMLAFDVGDGGSARADQRPIQIPLALALVLVPWLVRRRRS